MPAPLPRIAAGLWSFVVILSVWLFAPKTLVAQSSVRGHSVDGPGQILLVRGMLTVFSLGLDDLAEQLKTEGLEAQVVPASLSFSAVEGIAQQYASGQTRGPLVLIGHSLGGDLLPTLARQFSQHRVPIDLMVMIDSTNPGEPPSNVRRCVNLYQSNFSPTWFRVFRGAPINSRSRHTEMVNIDIRELSQQNEADGLNHFNIDSSTWIHRIVLRQVLPVFRSGGEVAVPGTIDTRAGRQLRPPAQTPAVQDWRTSRNCTPEPCQVCPCECSCLY